MTSTKLARGKFSMCFRCTFSIVIAWKLLVVAGRQNFLHARGHGSCKSRAFAAPRGRTFDHPKDGINTLAESERLFTGVLDGFQTAPPRPDRGDHAVDRSLFTLWLEGRYRAKASARFMFAMIYRKMAQAGPVEPDRCLVIDG